MVRYNQFISNIIMVLFNLKYYVSYLALIVVLFTGLNVGI